jgi:UTP-glucose-1-phosphate uridylyltransferase
VVQDGTGKVVELARDFCGADPFLLSYGDILVEPSNYQRLASPVDDVEAIISVKRNEDVSKGRRRFRERALSR